MHTYPHFTPRFPKQDWSLPLILEHQARTIGDSPFLQWTDKTPALSFAEVNRDVNRLANGLDRIGLRRGGRIILFMPNCLELVLLWFATNKLGAIEVPINISYRGSFLVHQVNTCEADVIVVADALLEKVVESLPSMPAIKRIIVWSPSGSKMTEESPLGCSMDTFESLYADQATNPGLAIEPHEPAAILFTSGTTGLSKGVKMPRAQLYLFAEEAVQLLGLTAADTHMTGFPLFHSNAQFLTVYPCLIAGCRCVLYERFSATEWVQRLHGSGATVTNALGVALQFIFAQPPTPHDNTHRLKRIFAAPSPHEMLDPFRIRFGVEQFVEGFGQTEICAPVMTPAGIERPKGACGVLVNQWFEVRLVDPETDQAVDDGDVGELVVRPREPWTITSGYVNMPEKTLEAYRNLWFHTGDAMRCDAQGWYYFVDRIKDALRRRGENISSFEVEEPIRAHPAVLDVAVIGVPADLGGGEQEVKACLILKSGQLLSAPELIEWCESRMPGFVVPRYVEFLTEMPKTPSEKTKTAELRKSGINQNTWDRVAAGYRLKEEAKREQRNNP